MKCNRLVRMLRDTPWCVDGRPSVIFSHSQYIRVFQRLNFPERANYRKCQQGNPSCDQLCHLIVSWQTFFKSMCGSEFQSDFKAKVATLAQALAGYVEYLAHKKIITKVHHACTRVVESSLGEVPSKADLYPLPLLTTEEVIHSKPTFKNISTTDQIP